MLKINFSAFLGTIFLAAGFLVSSTSIKDTHTAEINNPDEIEEIICSEEQEFPCCLWNWTNTIYSNGEWKCESGGGDPCWGCCCGDDEDCEDNPGGDDGDDDNDDDNDDDEGCDEEECDG